MGALGTIKTSAANTARKIKPVVWAVKKARTIKAQRMWKTSKVKGGKGSAADVAYIDRISHLLKNVPQSNGGRYYEKINMRIAIVSDDFLYHTYKDAADFVFVRPNSYASDIKDVDAFLYIAGWKGLEKEWEGMALPNSENRNTLYKVIDACKSKGLPTFFYSIEDPPNYDRFLGIAQKCDYVFTTAAEMAPKYRSDCGHDRVGVLRFGINPLFHNPVGMRSCPKQSDVLFSGSWMEKYPHRCADLCTIFDGILDSKYGLKVINRNFYLPQPEYRFPSKYNPFISPAVDHNTLQRVHKLYNWAVNINSVKESPTMFANRVYELQASGNLIISNYSVGVNSLLPCVFTVQNSQEVVRILNSMSDEEIYRRQVAGIRFAMSGESCFDRLGEMLSLAGIKSDITTRRVAVIADKLTEKVRSMFENQSYEERTLFAASDVTKDALDSFDIIAFFSDECDYGDYYLEDMINAFKYTNCRYITKDAYFENSTFHAGKEHDYVSLMGNKYRTVFWKEDFELDFLLALSGIAELDGGYSIDRFGFSQQKASCNYELSVVVPIYNNGRHLYGKAFSSLMRSSIFNSMQVILVDDGSTDSETIKITKNLEKQYSNVRAFFFNDGGSGSASRPRNKGVELANTKYITFLDPDNEAICDGYAVLLDAAKKGGYDLTVGNIIKYTTKEMVMNYYHYFKNRYGNDEVCGNKKEFFEGTDFCPMSIQAMVFEKQLVTQNGLEQVVGAVGQDSLFSWQLLYYAKKIKALNLPIHIYYAMTDGSVTNTVGTNYFKKQHLLEVEQIKWLRETALLDTYMNRRFNLFITGWVFKKLAFAQPHDAAQCARLVEESIRLYGSAYKQDDRTINNFLSLCEQKDYEGAQKSIAHKGI